MANPTIRPFVDSHATRIRVAEQGTFFCPSCRAERPYRLVEVRRAVKLGWVPVWSYGRPDAHVECLGCRYTFIPEALQPEARAWDIKPNHLWAARRVMVLIMLADGVIEDEEIRTISQVYGEIAGKPLPESAVRSAAAEAAADPRDAADFLDDIATRLNERGKLAVLRSAWRVATADGEVQAGERELLIALVRALHLQSADPLGTLGIDLAQA